MTNTPEATDRLDDWLVRQMEAWPTRVDPERTTNIEYLMKSGAKEITALKAENARLREALAAALDLIDGLYRKYSVTLDKPDAITAQMSRAVLGDRHDR